MAMPYKHGLRVVQQRQQPTLLDSAALTVVRRPAALVTYVTLYLAHFSCGPTEQVFRVAVCMYVVLERVSRGGPCDCENLRFGVTAPVT